MMDVDMDKKPFEEPRQQQVRAAVQRRVRKLPACRPLPVCAIELVLHKEQPKTNRTADDEIDNVQNEKQLGVRIEQNNQRKYQRDYPVYEMDAQPVLGSVWR